MNQNVDDAVRQRVRAVVANVVERRQNGEVVHDAAVFAAHPDLIDHLRIELAKLGFNAAATDVSSPTPDFPDVDPDVDNTIELEQSPTKGDQRPPRPTSSVSYAPPPGDADRFVKIESHAAGGMGRVWVALDTQIRRQVALKELKEERRADKTICDRFLAEGHVTGGLEHPGIVPVYALGINSQQQPYYAMRFVRGESLSQAIVAFHAQPTGAAKFSRSNLQFRGLLRRIADVCVTIAYAHSRGVLHRDLKPDNIMLGKYGETYVVDWGMARVLGTPAENASPATAVITKPDIPENSATRYGSAMGTPGYMSPEQAAGKIDELSVATDVYSLGAILYFLLTNQVSISADTLREFLRRVEAGEYQPPQIVSPHAPKGLCAVCQKSMAQSPADRYHSARDLATDIERWLADEPVSAAPESPAERMARFGRRHYRWLWPLLAAAVLIAVIASMAATSIQRARRRAESATIAEEQARGRAEQNFLDARDTVDQWLTGFTEALAYYPGVNDFRQRMLEQAAAHYERFLKQAGSDPVVQLEAGRTYLRLGDIRRQLRKSAEAADAYAQAVKIFQRLAKQSQPAQAPVDLAQAYGRLALAYGDVGDAVQERQFHQRAVELSTQLSQGVDQPQNDGQRIQRGTILANLQINYAAFLTRRGETNEAASRFADVVARLQQLASEDPGRLETRISLATAMLGWGHAIARLGDSAKARDVYRKAVVYFEAAAQLADEEPRYMKLTADANLFLATAEGMLGDYPAEAQAYREIIDAYERLNLHMPNSPIFLESLALTQVDLGQVLINLGDLAAAQPALEAAEASFARLKSAAPSHPAYQEAHGLALDLLSSVYAIKGARAEAVNRSQAALAELQELALAWPDEPQYQLRAATCQSHLAQLFAADEKFDEAEKQFVASNERLKAAIMRHADNPALVYAAAVTETRWGETRARGGDFPGASDHAGQSDRYWQRLRALSSDSEYLAGAAWHYAAFPVPEKRDPLRAAEYAHQAVKQAPENSYYSTLMALAEVRNGHAAEGLSLTTKLLSDQNADQNAYATLVARFVAALAHVQLGDRDAAERALDSAVAKMEEKQPGRWELQFLRRQCDEALGQLAAGQPSGEAD